MQQVWQRSTAGPKEMQAWVACFLHLHACMHAWIDGDALDDAWISWQALQQL